MSGDTPTDTTVEAEDEAALALVATAHSLDCPGCGSRVMVALDEDDADPDRLTARVYVYEHGGEVVARLRAEVDALKRETTSLASDVGGLEFELLTAQTEAACLTVERDALADLVGAAIVRASLALGETAASDGHALTAAVDRLRTRAEQAEAARDYQAERADTAVERYVALADQQDLARLDAVELAVMRTRAEKAEAARDRADHELWAETEGLAQAASTVAAFIGTLSSDEGDEEFIAMVTADDGTPGGEPASPCVSCGERCGSQLEHTEDNAGKPWPMCSGCMDTGGERPNPDDMHGACDEFGGEDTY